MKAFVFIFQIVLPIVILTLTAGLASAENNSLKLSDTFSATLPFDVYGKYTALPNLGIYVLRDQGKQITLQRVKPPSYPNLYLAKTIWNRKANESAKNEATSHNFGCKQMARGFFECTRSATTRTKSYITEMYVWSKSSDLVFVRVTSTSSMQDALTYSKKIKWRLASQ